ncbi:MAG: response regulator [Pseudolabrys sp.]
MIATTNGPGEAGLSGKGFLVVEDEVRLALDVERILEAGGANDIVTVSRNRDALERLKTERFDVAILDLKLNGDNSLPVAERLATLAVAFIFITGASAQAVPTGFRTVPVVVKPFDGDKLLAALRKASIRDCYPALCAKSLSRVHISLMSCLAFILRSVLRLFPAELTRRVTDGFRNR